MKATSFLFVALLASGAVETLILAYLFGFFLPVTTNDEALRGFYEKIVDVDGVLLGFAGILFGLVVQHWKDETRYYGFLIPFLMAVAWYLASIVAAFVDLLAMGTVTLLRAQFMMPLLFLVYGATFLVFGLLFVSSET
jgi:hypothetical protein